MSNGRRNSKNLTNDTASLNLSMKYTIRRVVFKFLMRQRVKLTIQISSAVDLEDLPELKPVGEFQFFHYALTPDLAYDQEDSQTIQSIASLFHRLAAYDSGQMQITSEIGE